ncbi:MAG: hypothetical protein IJQ13_08965 [Prevotella sp.]|nr:hypothetical protein [Prevotella sp.]
MMKVILSIILVSIGGCIYLMQRTTGILIFRIIDFLGLSDVIAGLRTSVVQMPEFVVFSLPGGLWSASYLLLADALLCHQSSVMRLSWGALIPMIGLVSELLQAAGLCPGTADWQDAVCYGIPYVVYVLWVIMNNKE